MPSSQPAILQQVLQDLYEHPLFQNRRQKQLRLLEYLIEHEEMVLRDGAPFAIRSFYEEDARRRGEDPPAKDLVWSEHPGKRLAQELRESLVQCRQELVTKGVIIEMPAGSFKPKITYLNGPEVPEPAPTDPQRERRRFWAPYLGVKDEEHPVLVGVLARLFFRIEGDVNGEDEVYVRSKLVNQGAEEDHKSAVLREILSRYPRHSEYRQYMSSGDAEGAFLLLEMCAKLGIAAAGVRTPGPNFRTCNSILLGTGSRDKAVVVPRHEKTYNYEAGPKGIHRRGGSVIEPFTDDWAETAVNHVLLSRWTHGRHVCTTIQSNGANAIAGVCHALCGEDSVGRVMALHQPAGDLEARFELVFRVHLEKGPRGYTADSVMLWAAGDNDQEEFIPVWPT